MDPRFWTALATLGPVGHIRPAPGSWGSATAILIAAGLVAMSGWLLEAALVAVCVVGVRAADVHEQVTGRKDASPVVIDEVAGQWTALLAAPFDWRWWLAAFVAFRVFDILKPGPVRLAERLPGGYGVMADDVVAGALAAAVLLAIQWGLS